MPKVEYICLTENEAEICLLSLKDDMLTYGKFSEDQEELYKKLEAFVESFD